MAAQEEEESREGVGIPLLCVHGNKPRDDILTAIKQQLPTPEEVSIIVISPWAHSYTGI